MEIWGEQKLERELEREEMIGPKNNLMTSLRPDSRVQTAHGEAEDEVETR